MGAAEIAAAAEQNHYVFLNESREALRAAAGTGAPGIWGDAESDAKGEIKAARALIKAAYEASQEAEALRNVHILVSEALATTAIAATAGKHEASIARSIRAKLGEEDIKSVGKIQEAALKAAARITGTNKRYLAAMGAEKLYKR